MNKEELIAFLKENLKVKIHSDYRTGIDDFDKVVVVTLVLCGEEIDQDETPIG